MDKGALSLSCKMEVGGKEMEENGKKRGNRNGNEDGGLSPESPNRGSWRRRKRRRKRKESRSGRAWAWLRANGIDLFLSLAALIGTALLFNFLRVWEGPGRFEGNLGNWLVYEGGAPQTGGVILVLAVLGGALRLRWRVLHHEQWWARVCPNCDQNALKRIHRRRLDRLWEVVRIPVRRYICGDCHWRGVRIDDRRL